MSEFVRLVEVGARDGLQNEKRRGSGGDQDRADRPTVRGRPFEHRGHQLRQPEVGAADGRRGRSLCRHRQQRKGVSYPVLVPNEQGYERARAVGVRRDRGVRRRLGGLQPPQHQRQHRRVDRTLPPGVDARQADGVRVRGYVSTVLGCPYQGEVPLADVVRVAARLHAMGCYEVSLGDTIGVGTPGGPARCCGRSRPRCRWRRWRCISTTPTARRSPTSWPAWRKACAWSMPRLPAPAAALMPRAPAAMSPARTWSTCCTDWASHTGVDLAALVDTGRWLRRQPDLRHRRRRVHPRRAGLERLAGGR
jgi:hypothetical protein